MDVVGSNCEVGYFTTNLGRLGIQQGRQQLGDRSDKNGDPILGYPDEVVVDVVDRASSSSAIHKLGIPRKETASIPHPG